ncbi:D-alanyl-D-alanine carboxypeptidase family protein [Diplocloster agilis]|uniref:serine-type D-Ala-D-Ala carboxypeptidase n=1 Tax=Diplocloster agilis TaxID=2850323 RepID=A0A949NFB2_9FIRM|nr:D-alanyl-D-alanine carboxypeptidase family protein [Diplocloster agilis]MBU9738196.1 D-alanyl-D-alanine carboxypeptidase [Diplocloster agilis]MBU9743699.1 D-alanyl-D-alanine carboxypeptidase [Diplocloster agilis]
MKRILTFILTAGLCLSLLPAAPVYAEETPEQQEGQEAQEGQENQEEQSGQETEDAQDGQESQDNQNAQQAPATEGLDLAAPSAILLEASTGQVIYEKNSTERLRPASITKIMTLILTFDALAEGKIHLQDEVTTSAYAKSMGGSQVFLEEGEKQTVETLIKCIVVASGNDASVAMAEFIAGSEPEFIGMMNARAQGLGMEQTHFEDCCGLTESDTHLTSARDVAIMSRELITKYPEIHKYSSIWMEDITHVTNQGSSQFTLSNTNKLVRQYDGCNGLKTGSTSLAKYCVSATAERNGVQLIAVVMAAPDFKVRFQDASKMLDFGFAKARTYEDRNQDPLPNVAVKKGVEDQVGIAYSGEFHYLDLNGADLSGVTKEIRVEPETEAPVAKDGIAGQAVYLLNGQEIGKVDIKFVQDVAKATFKDYLGRAFGNLLL